MLSYRVDRVSAQLKTRMGGPLERDKREAIKAYFAPFPWWAVWAVTGISVCIAWQGIFFAYGLGWIVIAAAGWFLKDWFRRPSDESLDLWTQEDLAKVIPRALEKCQLDPGDTINDPDTITSIRLRSFGKAFFGVKRGRDHLLRFTPIHVVVINYTQYQLVIYQCALDLTTGVPLNERVDEYFYKDIVSVTTDSQVLTLPRGEVDEKLLARFPGLEKAMSNDKLQLKCAESFILTTSGATSVEVVLRDPVLMEALGASDCTIPTDRADKAVRAVRKMLREKASER